VLRNPFVHNRKSIRLQEYDYSRSGEYFITICTYDKKCVFGEAIEEKIRLSPIGEIAKKCWEEIPNHFSKVELDEYVIMPNHLHGIIIFNETVGVEYIQPLQNKYQRVISKSLGSIIRSYKAAVTRECHKNNYSYFKWQSLFYDRIIRSHKELDNIRDYIIINPLKWYLDEENPYKS
jgi:putative transposase